MCEEHDGCDGNCDCHDKVNFLDDPAFGEEVKELAKVGWDTVELAVYTEADLLPSDDVKLQEAIMADWRVMRGFLRAISASAKISPPQFMKLLDDLLVKSYPPTLVKSFVATLMDDETRTMLGLYAIAAELRFLSCMLIIDRDVKIENLPIPDQIKIMAWLPDYCRGRGGNNESISTVFQCRMFTMLACAHSMTMARERMEDCE